MSTHRFYYQIKPFIPRSLQIFIRREIARRKRKLYTHVWPIDEEASKPPEGWVGWPESKTFSLVLTHDVDTARGHERCRNLLKIENELGFKSSFNFVPERYEVSSELRRFITDQGFGVGVHGLKHDNKLFSSIEVFKERAKRINAYLADWDCSGFTSPSMYHHLDWMHGLEIDFDTSTFDTDPFEPQPDGIGTIFPFWVSATRNPQFATVSQDGFVEMPYTLPQDHCLFIILQEKDISIWKKKLDWIAERGGMALLNTHPDYMNFDGKKLGLEEYPAKYFEEFLKYVKDKYEGQYWHALPKEMARFWARNHGKSSKAVSTYPPSQRILSI
jgi:hypothetical protein